MAQYLFPFEQGATILEDPNETINHICILAQQKQEREHCILALAKKTGDISYEIYDSCAAEEIGGCMERNLSTIPKKVSLALIRLCVKRESVPVILHTHAPVIHPKEPVIFSQKDRIFMDRFSKVAIAQGLHSPGLFLVTNGQSILLCNTSNMTRQYAWKEEIRYV